MLQSTQEATRISPGVLRWVQIVFIALMPTLVSRVLGTSQASLGDFITHWNDEVMNYHQILTFRSYGFEGGYYTLNELSAVAPFTHFYTYGPWLSMLYGLPARITGWQPTTFLLFNVILVTAALLVFLTTVPLNNRQLWLVGLFLATFWGLHLYYLSAMQEAVQVTFGILIAAVFFQVLSQEDRTPPRTRILGFVLIMLASLLRLSWAMLFLPLLVLTWPKTLRRLLLALAITGVTAAILILVSWYVGARGNNSVFTQLGQLQSPLEGIQQIITYFVRNFLAFLRWFDPGAVQNFQVFILILSLGIMWVVMRHGRSPQQQLKRRQTLFHFYNLGGLFIASLLLYFGGGLASLRIFLAHLMISMLLMIALKSYPLVWFFIVTNIVAIPVYWTTFTNTQLPRFLPDIEPTRAEQVEFAAIANQYLVYDPQAVSPWCNTLYMPVEYLDRRVNVVPAGIGLSFFIELPVQPVRSHYLLLSSENRTDIASLPEAPRLEKLVDTPRGTLYRNLNAGCD